MVETVPLARCAPATESPPPTIIEEMKEVFLKLEFSQRVAMKLVDDQGIDSPWTLASISDKDITTICNMSQRPGGFASSGKMLDRENQISICAMKNLMLAAFTLKLMEHCSKDINIRCSTSTSVLKYQDQWELEQKKTENSCSKLMKTTG